MINNITASFYANSDTKRSWFTVTLVEGHKADMAVTHEMRLDVPWEWYLAHQEQHENNEWSQAITIMPLLLGHLHNKTCGCGWQWSQVGINADPEQSSAEIPSWGAFKE